MNTINAICSRIFSYFINIQRKILVRNAGKISPICIYKVFVGAAVAQMLKMTQPEVIRKRLPGHRK